MRKLIVWSFVLAIGPTAADTVGEVVGRVSYDGPVVELTGPFFRTEIRCLRQAVKLEGKTCVKIPAAEARSGQWSIVVKGDEDAIRAMWAHVSEFRSECEAKPTRGDSQSTRFWAYDRTTRECVLFFVDLRRPGEPWM